MDNNIMTLKGIVDKGLRHASGVDEDGTEYPGPKGIVGTIERQRPFFEEVIPDFSEIYNGTLNVNIHPKKFEIKKPDYEVICDWREDGLPQTFWFVNIELNHNENSYEGLVYHPCPRQGKARKRESTFELLFPFIQNLNYGAQVSISYSSDKMKIN